MTEVYEKWEFQIGTLNLQLLTCDKNHVDRPRPNAYSDRIFVQEISDGTTRIGSESSLLSEVTLTYLSRAIINRFPKDLPLDHFLLNVQPVSDYHD